MSDLALLDEEHPTEKLSRRQRAEKRASGARGSDGLTDGDRALLETVRAIGFDIQRTWLLGKNGQPFQHRRAVVKRAPNWYNSIR